MIGNDIISLQSLPDYSVERRDRFALKILTAREHQNWRKHGSTEMSLFKYWALKEASYKVWNRQSHKRVFNPKSFSIENLVDGKTLIVSSPSSDYQGRVKVHKYFIYAEVTEPAYACLDDIVSVVRPIGCNRHKGECLVKEKGLPFFNLNGDKIPVSISHCGAWEAVAFLRSAKIDKLRRNIHTLGYPLARIG